MYKLAQIYEDPITRTRLEGWAYLIKLLSSFEGMEYWRVCFKGESDYVNRHILNKELRR